MFPNFGEFCLFIALLTQMISLIITLKYILFHKYPNLVPLHWSISTSFMLITISFVSLMYAYIVSDFSISVVIENSQINQPLIYKIAGVWGNHEGSMLLWCWVMNGYLFSVSIITRTTVNRFLILQFCSMTIISIFFLSFTLLTSNPFTNVNFLTLNGSELNPILQDPGLAIHPPLLYHGYIGTSLIYSLSISYLMSRQTISRNYFLNILKLYTMISWSFLTIGILLGSWWAYYELGWGGWWFWDPVENVSLIPWLLLTGLMHSIIISFRDQQVNQWTILLGIFSFLTSLLGTFFVRSGLLNSVHSFANDSVRGIFILAFFVIVFIITLVIYYISGTSYSIAPINSIYTKDFTILVNNWLIISMVTGILVGTFGPVFYKLAFEREVSIGPSFYNKILIPLCIPFLLGIIFQSKFNWKRLKMLKNPSFNKPNLLFLLIVNLFILLGIINYLDVSFLSKLFILLSVNVIVVSITQFIKQKNNKKKYHAFLAHAGIGFLVLSITASSYMQMESIQLVKPGDFIHLDNYSYLFRGIDYGIGPNYISCFSNFLILDDKYNVISVVFPEKRFYYTQGVYTIKAAIISNLSGDLYTVVDDGNFKGGWYTRVYYSPLMNSIWMSGLLITLAGILSTRSIIKYSKNNKIDWN